MMQSAKEIFLFLFKIHSRLGIKKRYSIFIIIKQTCEGGECDECHNKDVAQLYSF